MQPGSREPENYSIDDMMERLKRKPASNNEDDGGELVTRDDGTQVMRVRKRKRRSKQPIKEREKFERKRKFAQLLALMVVTLAITGLFAGGIIYSNSRPFRDGLIDKITAATGAEGELRQFRMNPTSANADLLTLNWPAGNPIESLQIRSLRADASITSIFGKSFEGSELFGSQGTLTLRVPDSSHPRTIPQDGDPGTIDFERISLATLHIMPGDNLPRMLRLRDTEASFYPNRGSGSAPQMRLNGGNLQAPGLPQLRLDRALLEFRNTDINLAVARMFHGEDELGEFLLSGPIQTADETSQATLTTEMQSFLIEGIVGERMARIISGRIDTIRADNTNTLKFPVGNPAAGELDVQFESSLTYPFMIHGFNFLSQIAILLDDAWFEQPYFEGNVTGTIHRKDGDVHIRNFNAENRNRMAIRGNITLTSNQHVSGKLDVGIPHSIVATAPNPRLNQSISEASGGYRWVSIDIGGNFNAPTDNFMTIIDNPPDRQDPPESRFEGSTFEDLTRPR